MVDLNDQRLRRQNALNDITETTGLVVPRPDDRLRPLPRPQVRPDPPGGLLPAPGVLRRLSVPRRLPAGDVRSGRRTSRRWPPGGPRSRGCSRRSSGIEKPVRDRLAPGLPMGALDDAVRRVQQARVGADPGRGRARSTPCSAATAGSGRPTGRGCSTRPRPPDGKDSLAELDRTDEGRAPPAADGPRDRRGRPGSPRRPTSSAAASSPPADRRSSRRSPPCCNRWPSVRRSAPPSGSSGRRRALADWLTRPDHPLTARVMVNRLWQQHFGRGLVGTSSDFGTMGDEPSHPELLDWLATELVAQGWSLKAIHRLIVTSATYRQSSRPRSPAEREADPENRWLSGQNRRRLDGEAIRDALLAGLGSAEPGPRRPRRLPPLPPELTKLSSKGAIWPVSRRIADQDRRSLYVFVRRNLRYPFFEAFDRPDTNASCPRRPVTTIAPQALSLLNSSLSAEAARAAARAARDARPVLDAETDSPRLSPDDRPPTRRRRAGAGPEFLSADGGIVRRLLPRLDQPQRVRLRRLNGRRSSEKVTGGAVAILDDPASGSFSPARAIACT